MRYKMPAAGVGDGWNNSLAGRQAKFRRFLPPRFDDSAASIKEQHFAHSVGDEQATGAIEGDSAGHEAGPNVLKLTFAVENLNSRIVAIAHKDALVGAD